MKIKIERKRCSYLQEMSTSLRSLSSQAGLPVMVIQGVVAESQVRWTDRGLRHAQAPVFVRRHILSIGKQ